MVAAAPAAQQIGITGLRRAVAIARDQAAQGVRVLVLEAPRPTSQLGPMFGLSTDAPGMYEMLLPPPHNRFDTIYPTGHDGMFVMPSGEAKFRPTIWEMEWLYERLGQHFDCIVTEFDD